MLKRRDFLVKAVGSLFVISANSAFAALPESVKMIIAGGDPELKFAVRNGKLYVTMPFTDGQSKDMKTANPGFQAYGSKAIFRDGLLVLVGEENIEKYQLTTKNEGNTVVVEIPLPEAGSVHCYRVWAKSGNTWLWISQASAYCRFSTKETGNKPAYEFAVYPDGKVEVIPKGWIARP